MLRKIISIKNVGRFLNCSASGDVELKRYNLVFAENGRGKTTLCAVLRSLQSGEPAHVLGRTTLGTGDAPEIKVLLGGGAATFSNGAWSATVPELAIFDSTFVSENVYSSDAVDLDHRRNLYRVIVGKQGVDLARQIDNLDAASRAKSAGIRERLTAVQPLVPQGLAVEAFLTLQEDPAIDPKIAEKERELQAVREADQIKNHAALSELALPVFPVGFETLLGKTIEGIAADAERRVAGQIKAHGMHDRGETWLSDNSQDSFRKNCTVQKITKCGETCTQVLVLSHDDRFLKLVWDRLAHLPAERKCLRLARIGLRDTTVSEWDIEVATQAQFHADRQALADYYNSAEGHPRDVVNRIRPVLETYCRNLYPTQFTPADNLGAIIARIRSAGPAHPLAGVLDDLETLNAYTTPYAHGQPDAATAPVDDNELHGMVKRTLTITGGC